MQCLVLARKKPLGQRDLQKQAGNDTL